MRLIAEDLITSIKLRAMIPISQQTFTEEYLLQLATEEQNYRLVPQIKAIQENYFLTYKRTSLVASKYAYPLPERAMGNALKDIWVIDSAGNRSRTIPQTDVHRMGVVNVNADGVDEFMMMGDEIFVIPTPSTSVGAIEMWYYRRLNDIVLTEDCAAISSIASAAGTTTFTVDTDLTASLSVGDLVDIVSNKSPYQLWSTDCEITAITSTTIAVDTSEVSDEASLVEPVVGDYICPAKKTNIPNLPEDIHPLLAQMTASRVLLSLGDMNKYAASEQLAKIAWDSVANLLKNRIEDEIRAAPGNGILGSQAYVNAYGIRS